jgi:hypothetical protein
LASSSASAFLKSSRLQTASKSGSYRISTPGARFQPADNATGGMNSTFSMGVIGTVAPSVPEPSSFVLAAFGTLAVAMAARRRRAVAA